MEDGCENWDLVRWRGAVASAIRGGRGQQLLREMAAALDAMPRKRLIAEELEANGEVCALGCVGRSRGMDMSRLDPYEPADIAKAFGVAPALAQEITYINDDWGQGHTPEERWQIVRRWVTEKLHTA
jgi:hypothetical protein